MKKFSIGLTLLGMTKDEYIKIINEFGEYIETIYYSPCVDGFFSRSLKDKKINNFDKLDKEELEILRYARGKGILLELAINTKKKTKEEVMNVLELEKKRIIPDEIVTTSFYIEEVRKVFPKAVYTLSYNEGLFSIEQVKKLKDKFDNVVVGNRWIRDLNFMKEINKLGLGIKHMLNNGCSHNCTYCYSSTPCEDVMLFNISKFNIDVTYAMNTIYPFELHECLKKIKIINSFKISNRPCNYKELYMMLNSYINNINDYEDIEDEHMFFNVMSRIVYYKKFLKFINKEVVEKIKRIELKRMMEGMENEHND